MKDLFPVLIRFVFNVDGLERGTVTKLQQIVKTKLFTVYRLCFLYEFRVVWSLRV